MSRKKRTKEKAQKHIQTQEHTKSHTEKSHEDTKLETIAYKQKTSKVRNKRKHADQTL